MGEVIHMAGNAVAVNLGELDRFIGQLAAFSRDIDAKVDSLASHIDGLHAQWHGTAAQAHAKAHAEWAQGAQLMSDGIRRLEEASANAHSAFTTTVQANKALFS
ncbi:WXG100 family type VII secretion target [Mycobacterium sp. HM-7]